MNPNPKDVLQNLIDGLPMPGTVKFSADQVKNLFQELLKGAQPEAECVEPHEEELSDDDFGCIGFVYFKNKDDREGKEWVVNFQTATTVCFSWRETPYLVVEGPYTPVCFNLNRAFEIETQQMIGFGLGNTPFHRVFLTLNPEKFPSEKFQQDLLNISKGR